MTPSRTPSVDMAQQLIASEERFQSIVQTATDAIVLWKEQGNILFWNKGAQTMFGYTSKERVGNPLLPIIHTSHEDSFHQMMSM